MPLETTIMEQLKTAMKEKNEVALRSLRAIKAAIIIAKTSEGANGEISEAEEVKMLQKLIKQRRDSIEIFSQQNRNELAQKELDEVAVIEKFLPQQLTEAELKEALTNIITQSGATSAADMGKVIGLANKQLAGKTDGKAISTMVKQLLP